MDTICSWLLDSYWAVWWVCYPLRVGTDEMSVCSISEGPSSLHFIACSSNKMTLTSSMPPTWGFRETHLDWDHQQVKYMSWDFQTGHRDVDWTFELQDRIEMIPYWQTFIKVRVFSSSPNEIYSQINELENWDVRPRNESCSPKKIARTFDMNVSSPVSWTIRKRFRALYRWFKVFTEYLTENLDFLSYCVLKLKSEIENVSTLSLDRFYGFQQLYCKKCMPSTVFLHGGLQLFEGRINFRFDRLVPHKARYTSCG